VGNERARDVGDALVATCRQLALSRETFELASLILAELEARGPWPEDWRVPPLAAALAYGASRLSRAETLSQEDAARAAGTSAGRLRRSLAAVAMNLDLDFGVQFEAQADDRIARPTSREDPSA
jgi:hypothetical protein